MTRIQDGAVTTHGTRRGPVLHSEAVQEAKRLEKMQSLASSHRTSGTVQHPPAPARDETR